MDSSLKAISAIMIEILDPHVEFIFLMGSAGTDKFHDKSDVDIGVFWKPSTDEKNKQICARNLEDKFGREVDLVSLNKIDVIFGRQVLETGRLILNHSPGILLDWKMNILSAYPDFKVSRKIIEDNILNRKKYV